MIWHSKKTRYDSLKMSYEKPKSGGDVAKDSTVDSQENESLIFFFHPDHLGSTSYVTGADGTVAQHVEYIPYGEVFVEERNSSFSTSYLFNAKELDSETGMYYYGARYLDPTNAMWISVDPMWEKFAGMSAYNYCAGNPVIYIDPTGEYIRIAYTEGNEQKYYHYKIGEKCNVKNAYVQNTVLALNHLCEHEGSKNNISEIANSTKRVLLQDTKNAGYAKTSVLGTKKGDFLKAIIEWNPNTGSTLVDDTGFPCGTQSPASQLNHELDHALDAIKDFSSYKEKSTAGSDEQYFTISDRKTITGIETDAAIYFDECTRKNHDVGRPFYTDTPTSNIPSVRPPVNPVEKGYKQIEINER